MPKKPYHAVKDDLAALVESKKEGGRALTNNCDHARAHQSARRYAASISINSPKNRMGKGKVATEEREFSMELYLRMKRYC